MRNTPLAVFLALVKKFKKDDVAKVDRLIERNDILILDDIKMTHSHPATLEGGKQWVHLLSDLILREEFTDIEDICNKFFEKEAVDKEFGEWKKKGQSDNLMNATTSQGYAKIAYSYGLTYLRKIVNYYYNE